MSNRMRLLLVFAAAAMAAADTAHADIDMLLKPAETRSVTISPDGKYLAMVRSDDFKDTLVIFERPAMRVVTGASSSVGERFQRVTWVNRSRLLLEPATDRGATVKPRPTGAILSLGVDGTRQRLLGGNSRASVLTTAIVSILPNDPSHVLVAAHHTCEPGACTDEQAARRTLVKLNVSTGTKSSVAPALTINAYYVSDPSGARLMAAGRDADGSVVVYRLVDGAWNTVTAFDPVNDLGTVPLAIDRAGTVFALANKVGTAGLYSWNLASGETTEIYRGAGSDVDNVVLSYGARRLLAVRSDPGFPSWHYLAPEQPFATTHKALRAAFPDSDVDVTSFTADGSEMVVRVHSDRNSGDFYIVNTDTRGSTLLATSRPWLPAGELASVEPLEITTRDMFTVRGYLTVPVGDGPHPMVVWLHDEPYTSRATWELNTEVQMLVRRGFAVLQINYRGSAGLGQWYQTSGAERDGQAVQRDIADATKWAIEQNIALEDQICVYGRGYGGFAAVKALATNIGLFRCAVAIDGIYDLSAPFDVPEDPTLTPQSLLTVRTLLDMADTRRSPVNRVSNIDAPVLLVGDSAQTSSMREALQASDKRVEWSPVDDDVGRYEDILAYLENQLSGGAATEAQGPAGFGATLTAQQSRAFQRIKEQMRQATRSLGTRRLTSAAAVRREVGRIIDRHDGDVKALVSDEQWALYDDFKPGLAAELEGELDIVRLQ